MLSTYRIGSKTVFFKVFSVFVNTLRLSLELRYVFYHRLTHKSDYSRQACAEKISIDKDGSVKQVEVTSCGLNSGPLEAKSDCRYPAVIACNLTNGHMPHGSNSVYQTEFPNVTNICEDRFIAEIEDGTLIGYKYFNFENVNAVSVTARIETAENKVVYSGPIRIDERCVSNDKDEARTEKHADTAPVLEIYFKGNGEKVGEISIGNSAEWTEYRSDVKIPDGVHALYFVYHGSEKIQLKEIAF